jgi:hypothetical protein
VRDQGVQLTGRVVAVGAIRRAAANGGSQRLERGRLAVVVVVDGLPVGELPSGARLRIGETVIVELGRARASAEPGVPLEGPEVGGVVEAGASDLVGAEVLQPGDVAPGDDVSLEAVALPLADVLDLHAFRPEDTTKVLGDYLDEARRAGLGEVRIVHGRGKGVQRAIVRRFLSEAAGVIEFVEAPQGRGGWGATVVRLHRVEDSPSA